MGKRAAAYCRQSSPRLPLKRQAQLNFNGAPSVFVSDSTPEQTRQELRQRHITRQSKRNLEVPVWIECVPSEGDVFSPQAFSHIMISLGCTKPSTLQLKIVAEILATLVDTKPEIRIEAPTGAGKTLATLSGALAYIWDRASHGEITAQLPGIMWLARTHEEILHARKELQKLPYKTPAAVRLSRQQLCVLPKVRKSTDMSAACEEATTSPASSPQGFRRSGCKYLDKAESIRYPDKHVAEFCSNGRYNQIDIEDLTKSLESRCLCPYHAMADLSTLGAGVTFGTYSHLTDPLVRYISGMEKLSQGSILIIDEAHNLEETAMEAASIEITASQLIEAASPSIPGVSALLEKLGATIATARTITDAISQLSVPALEEAIRCLRSSRAFEITQHRASPAVRALRYNVIESLFRRLILVLGDPDSFCLIRNASSQQDVEILCIDANTSMRSILQKTHATIYISGTMPDISRPLSRSSAAYVKSVKLHFSPEHYERRVLVRSIGNLNGVVMDSRRARRPANYMSEMARFIASVVTKAGVCGGVLVYFANYSDLIDASRKARGPSPSRAPNVSRRQGRTTDRCSTGGKECSFASHTHSLPRCGTRTSRRRSRSEKSFLPNCNNMWGAISSSN